MHATTTKLESLADARQLFDQLHRYLLDHHDQTDRYVAEAIGHAADASWCLQRAERRPRVDE